MAIPRALTVSITPKQDALVRTCVQSGRYPSASEVVRAALRPLERDGAASAVDLRRKAPDAEVVSRV